ncbi:cupin domain-containing protein [Candidatus Woesearchaeota archaeon]|nr:cupin domain-containing protein [Candidatus Woesearchaeota archaeon]
MNSVSLIKPPKSRVLKAGKVSLSPDEEIDEHITLNREELIYILKGRATLFVEGEKICLNEKEFYYIKKDIKHKVKNESNFVTEYLYIVGLI